MVTTMINSRGTTGVLKNTRYSNSTGVLLKKGKENKLVKNGYKFELYPSSDLRSVLDNVSYNQ